MTDRNACNSTTRPGQVLLSAFIVLAGFMVDAGAAIIVVNTTEDVVAEDGQCSLREAITNANWANQSGSVDCVAGESDHNVIIFAPELAGETIVLNGEQLQVGSRDLTIAGPVPGEPSGITLDGNLASRVLRVAGHGVHVQVTLRDLTIRRGRTSETFQRGGGLLAQSVSLLAENIVVADNSTEMGASAGGGICVFTAELELVDSLVTGNRTEATTNPGGGISVQGGTLTLTRSRIHDNRTEGSSANAAGIHATSWGEAGSQLSLVNSIVDGNSATQGTNFGGGIWAEQSMVSIIGSTISGNSVTGGAGGVYVDQGELLMVNSTVSGNSASAAGAGLQIRRSEATLLHSTVAFNFASSGGARDISVLGTNDDASVLYLINSLVVQDLSTRSTCSAGTNASIVNAGSLSTHTSCTGTATVPEAIALEVLANNGGPTPTHRIPPYSVAAEAAGDCQSDHDLNRDQRGLPRPGGYSTACDVGAYESQLVGDEIFLDRFTDEC